MIQTKNTLSFRSIINHPAEEVFSWYSRPKIIERSIPPCKKMKILSSKGRPDKFGSKIIFRLNFFKFFWKKFVLEFNEYIPNKSFNLSQKEGFFRSYEHRTTVIPQCNHSSHIIDDFEFSFKFPKFFLFIIKYLIKKRLSRTVEFKNKIIKHDLSLFKQYSFDKRLKILVTGSHGLIGSHLVDFLECAEHDVWRLVRSNKTTEKQTIIFDPNNYKILENFDMIINLAGENISSARWSPLKKEKILKSRYNRTKLLVETLFKMDNPPKVFISASAVGYYGDHGSKVVNESSLSNKGLFISKVCNQWEQATHALNNKSSVRVVQARFGVVLTPFGGALSKMIIPFKWGLGGKIGDGSQYISWIGMDDALGTIYHIMMTPSLKGPVNIVSPYSVTNTIFSRTLAKKLNRWLAPSIPKWVIRMVYGEKGEELLLASVRAYPNKLVESGYNFKYPNLQEAFEDML